MHVKVSDGDGNFITIETAGMSQAEVKAAIAKARAELKAKAEDADNS